MTIRAIFVAAILAALPYAAGCGWHAQQSPGDASAPTTRVLLATEPDAGPPSSSTADTNAAVQANIDRFYGSKTEHEPYGQAARPPGDAKLGNEKARQFGDFSYVLARRTLKTTQDLEPEKLAHRKMRDDLKQVVLTAVMDQGEAHRNHHRAAFGRSGGGPALHRGVQKGTLVAQSAGRGPCRRWHLSLAYRWPDQ